jgi:transcriptional regulator
LPSMRVGRLASAMVWLTIGRLNLKPGPIMHLLKPIFEIEREEALSFAAGRGFGLFVVQGGPDAGPFGSHIPFRVDTSKSVPVAQFHVTAGNSLATIPDGTKCLLAVWGQDAYVSNDWYATPDHVSTWLYEAVHLSGRVRRLSLHDNRKHGDDLVEAFEKRLLPKTPWDLKTMEPTKRETMLRSIVVLEMEIERIEGQRKLNQHKSDKDHVSVARHLVATGEPAAIAIAEKMRGLRPHLDYSADGEAETPASKKQVEVR